MWSPRKSEGVVWGRACEKQDVFSFLLQKLLLLNKTPPYKAGTYLSFLEEGCIFHGFHSVSIY